MGNWYYTDMKIHHLLCKIWLNTSSNIKRAIQLPPMDTKALAAHQKRLRTSALGTKGVPWWDTMQMVLDKTSECDDQGAWESMIMDLLYHAEPWPALLFLCGCFVKQTGRGGAYWWALLSCNSLCPKPDAAKFPYRSTAQHVVLCLRSIPGCWCSCDTSYGAILEVRPEGRDCFPLKLCNL